MGKIKAKTLRTVVAGALAAGLAITGAASAEEFQMGDRVVKGERYIPTIWIDPDGCEHWVMDDGAEGYMSPHRTRQGLPVCHDINVCGVMNTDQLFATDSYRIAQSGRARLQEFFKGAQARAFIIVGHTDSRASDEYNMRLSYNRANSVAKVAAGVGANVIDVRGYGERMPKVPNTSAANMQQNRRVEVLCIK
ncbi:OmpA family protein [Thalassovita sp.]|uniref:OmpA family protein n=1 Tax=Thalassovita sp. TaxID=1979401 RepID=UPI0029DE8634|nr:OmpA family protein [Thalassovita sp.]